MDSKAMAKLFHFSHRGHFYQWAEEPLSQGLRIVKVKAFSELKWVSSAGFGMGINRTQLCKERAIPFNLQGQRLCVTDFDTLLNAAATYPEHTEACCVCVSQNG